VSIRLKETIPIFQSELVTTEGNVPISCRFLTKGTSRYSCLNRADLIRVHDGTDSGAPTIAVLCNQGTEVEVLSTGPGLYIEFVANSEWPGQGFKAMFQFQPLDDALHPGQ